MKGNRGSGDGQIKRAECEGGINNGKRLGLELGGGNSPTYSSPKRNLRGEKS